MMNTTRTKTRKATASPMYRVRSDVGVPWAGLLGASSLYTTTGRPWPARRPGLHMPPVQFLLAMSLPWQYLPPLLGVGLEQVLRRKWMQSVEHVDHEDQPVHAPSTAGHTLEQLFFWTAGPSHPGPPLTGAGESQDLRLTLTPRPQSTLQPDHSPQDPQLPGTEREELALDILPFVAAAILQSLTFSNVMIQVNRGCCSSKFISGVMSADNFHTTCDMMKKTSRQVVNIREQARIISLYLSRRTSSMDTKHAQALFIIKHDRLQIAM